MAHQPLSPRLLFVRLTPVSEVLTLSAPAISKPAAGPSLLDERSSTLSEPRSAHATPSTVCRSPRSSPLRLSSSPSTPAARRSPLPNVAPLSRPSLTTFAQNGPHFQGGESRGSRFFRYSWNERCDDRICNGSASSKLSNGSLSCATRSRTARSAFSASAGNVPVQATSRFSSGCCSNSFNLLGTNSARAARLSCASPKSRTSAACASKNVTSSKLIRCGTVAAAAPRSLRSTRSSIAFDAVSYNGDDHREHERVARDALLSIVIKGHARWVAQVLEQIRVIALAEPLNYHLRLLRVGQRLQLYALKVLAEPARCQASWA
eukprot:scaffold4936_cov73-Phaeocystis_antarctica.AAC.7